MQERGKKSVNNISTLPVHNAKSASQLKLLIIFTLIIIFVIGGVYSYFKMIKTMEFSPQKLFEQAFVEPVESVTMISGDSKNLLGFDSWIRFKSNSEIHLKNATDFKPYISEVGRSGFAEKYPGDRSLQQPVNTYDYLVRTEHTVGKIVNEALLINKTSHEYFYRIWGM